MSGRNLAALEKEDLCWRVKLYAPCEHDVRTGYLIFENIISFLKPQTNTDTDFLDLVRGLHGLLPANRPY